MAELKESAFPLLRESQVVIEVEKLSVREKEQILYNHVQLGDEPSKFKTAIKRVSAAGRCAFRFCQKLRVGWAASYSPVTFISTNRRSWILSRIRKSGSAT